jgi:hypothetical protein
VKKVSLWIYVAGGRLVADVQEISDIPLVIPGNISWEIGNVSPLKFWCPFLFRLLDSRDRILYKVTIFAIVSVSHNTSQVLLKVIQNSSIFSSVLK